MEWETFSSKKTIKFKITAKPSADIFSEIEGAIKKYKAHLIEGKLDETEAETLIGFFTIEIENEGELKKIIKSLRSVPAILNIQVIN